MEDTPDIEALKAEHLGIRRQSRALAAVSLGILIGGAVFFHRVEHLKWLDSFYFCTITLTTVGYGDITPHTDAGKIFDMFYVLVGIGIIATSANFLVKNTMVRRQLKLAQRQKSKQRPPAKR